jgi:hypothetical protein
VNQFETKRLRECWTPGRSAGRIESCVLTVLNATGSIMINDLEILHGLSSGELDAIAEVMLAPSLQVRLDEYIALSKEQKLKPEEAAELDWLLARVDQLTLVKTRARYTLHRQRTGASSAQSETQS